MVMAKLLKKDTVRVAELAKLTLTPSEVDKFTPQLSAIIDLIDELNKVDTKNTEPTAQTTNLTNVFRHDVTDPTKTLTIDEVVSGTENTQNGFITVPQILHIKVADDIKVTG